MKTITLKLLLAFVVVMSVVMIGSSMAHQHQTYLLTAAEEEATTNESDTKLVAAANNNRNAAAVFDGASAFTRLWTQLVSGYDWMTRQLTDNSDVEFEETRESKGFFGRTFGLNRLKKKLAIGFIPIAFKLGILSVVVFTILMLSIKSVFLGTTLLIINLGFIFAKILAWKKQGGDFGHGAQIQQWPASYGGGSGSKNNDIHLHIHNPAPVSFATTEQRNHDLPYSGHTSSSNYGPSIHIEPAGGVGLSYDGGNSNSGWGGYKRARNLNYQF